MSLQFPQYKTQTCQVYWENSLNRNRAVWDFVTDTLYFMGPGDYDLAKAMPPGTDSYQLETAPSGHSVLPCCEYVPASSINEHTLTLVASRRDLVGRHAGQSMPPPPVVSLVLPPTAARGETLFPPPGVEPSYKH